MKKKKCLLVVTILLFHNSKGGTHVTVIVIGNGIDKLSSNPEWRCLHFT